MLRPGERIGDWIVEARLGEGEHGAIFLARHGLNLNLRGALKVARPPDYEKSRANFIAEIEPLLLLRHEALIHVLGWGEDFERNLLWMTTELVRGRSLEERLGQGPFELEELGFVFGRLAGALALIHSHGAHHGDLRPSDVLLAEGRHIRITGFGTVFREGSQGKLDAESLAYVGPEYFDDPEGCSPVSADIYALGLILHEAITGRRVFPVDPALKPAPQMAKIMGMKLRMGPLDPGDDVPLPLRRIVLQTTDPDPEARPPDLSGFLTALSMATRERIEADEPQHRSVSFAPSSEAPATPRPTTSVRLESSVIGRQQRPTPFPFAPPGWGPRAHQVPSPMAGLERGLGRVGPGPLPQAPGISLVEREAAPPAPPLAESPLYDEPDVLAADDYDAYDAPEVDAPAAPAEDAWASVLAYEPDEEPEDEPDGEFEDEFGDEPEDEPEEATLAPVPGDEPIAPLAPEPEEDHDEAVLIEATIAPKPQQAWDAPEPMVEPAPVAQPASADDLRTARQRQRRTFVPPPPVPDPTLVGPGALSPGALDVPEPGEPVAVAPPAPAIVEPVAVPIAPAIEPVAVPIAPPAPEPLPPAPAIEAPVRAPVAAVVVPPAPVIVDPLPGPVAPSAPVRQPLGVASPTLLPIEDEPAPAAEQVPRWEEETEEASSPAIVPPDPQGPTAPDDQDEGPDDDEDWSWHDQEGAYDDEPAGFTRERVDPYTRPIDQLYADDLDPSASDIAADVFGDHSEGAAWIKWAAVITVVVCLVTFVFMFMNREQPSSVTPEPVRPPAVAEPVAPPPEPPPVEPEPAEPALDLGTIVEEEPAAVPEPPAPRPPDPFRPASSTPPAPTSVRSSPAPAPVLVPTPAPVAPVVAPSGPSPVHAVTDAQPAVGSAGPTEKGLMDHLRDGWSSLDAGNLVGAQGSFMAALSKDSGNGMAHYGLGQVAERARDYRSAGYHYGRALDALGGNPTMKGELQSALTRVGAKTGAAQPATPATQATPAPTPAGTDEVQVTHKKRDELEESFRQELWDEDASK